MTARLAALVPLCASTLLHGAALLLLFLSPADQGEVTQSGVFGGSLLEVEALVPSVENKPGHATPVATAEALPTPPREAEGIPPSATGDASLVDPHENTGELSATAEVPHSTRADLPETAPVTGQPAAAAPAPQSASDQPAESGGDAAESIAAEAHGSPDPSSLAARKPGTVGLAKAFTRAMPRAAFGDRTWLRLPEGQAGVIRFRLTLDEDGSLERHTFEHFAGQEPPRHLSEVVRKTTLMLKAGRFALLGATRESTDQRFELSASIDRTGGSSDEFAEPGDLKQMGRHLEPTLERPGKADFTYNSGRHVTLKISILPP